MSCEESAIFFANLAYISHIKQKYSPIATKINLNKVISTEVLCKRISINVSAFVQSFLRSLSTLKGGRLVWTFTTHAFTKSNLSVQVNLLQKPSFLHQLTHNMMRDCSWNALKSTCSEHVVYTNCFLFWHSEQFMYTTCSELVIVIQWTIFCHIVG